MLRLAALHRGAKPAFTIFYRAGAKELENAIYSPQRFLLRKKDVERASMTGESSRKNLNIVREVLSVRERDTEREREREREKDGSDVTIVALKLAMSFALFLAKNVHLSIREEFCAFPCQKIYTSVSPLLNGAEFTLSVAKNVALFETVRILRTAAVKWRDRQGIEAAKQTIEFPAAPFFFLVVKSKK